MCDVAKDGPPRIYVRDRWAPGARDLKFNRKASSVLQGTAAFKRSFHSVAISMASTIVKLSVRRLAKRGGFDTTP
jgi:hypothetical protein